MTTNRSSARAARPAALETRTTCVASPASVPSGLRIYAIGDVHGRADLLERLVRHIRFDLEADPPDSAICVLLGDYIDRGPDSARVLSFIAGNGLPVPSVILRGNHEQMLIDFLDQASHLDTWRQFGALETLYSFGVSVRDVARGQGFGEARSMLKAALAPRVEKLLRNTRSGFEIGGYFFCHAGIRPGVRLAHQIDSDLLWIRDEFTASTVDHGHIIVHGHTAVEQPEICRNRINIDTGAYLSGTLTCLVLQGHSQRFISVETGTEPASSPGIS